MGGNIEENTDVETLKNRSAVLNFRIKITQLNYNDPNSLINSPALVFTSQMKITQLTFNG